jgi:hypothetical protein
MSKPIDLGQPLELRDASGSTLGYFLSAGERKHWEEQCQRLREECQRLRLDVAKVTAERDQYLRSVYALTRKAVSFAPEELAEMEKNEVDIEQLLQEIHQAKKIE